MIDLSIPGLVTAKELVGIERLAALAPPGGTVVELGSLYGRSSFTWATSVDPTTQVYCIDPWLREPWIADLEGENNWPVFGYEAFQAYTTRCPNIVAIKGRSPQDVSAWSKPVDIFFDDSIHENPYFRKNLQFWYPRMKPGGIMSGHDYCDKWPDVRREVDILAHALGVRVETAGWVWSIKIPERSGWFRRLFRPKPWRGEK